jgi:hypothetical protein
MASLHCAVVNYSVFQEISWDLSPPHNSSFLTAFGSSECSSTVGMLFIAQSVKTQRREHEHSGPLALSIFRVAFKGKMHQIINNMKKD